MPGVSTARRPLWLEEKSEGRRGEGQKGGGADGTGSWGFPALPSESSGFHSARQEEPLEGSLQEICALTYMYQGHRARLFCLVLFFFFSLRHTACGISVP